MESWVVAYGLIGFWGGIVLYTFLLSILTERRERGSLELGLGFLIASLLAWYAGNFISLLLRQMDISRVSPVLGIVEPISFSGLAVLPALLVHTHWVYYRSRFAPTLLEKRLSAVILLFLYLPLIFLPGALRSLFPTSEVHPIERLGVFNLPFLILLAVSYYFSSYLEIRILRQSEDRVEKAVFKRLLAIFLFIPVFNFYVLWPAASSEPPAEFWMISASLSSVLPSIVVLYYIYHYRFLHLVIHRGISTAILLLSTLALYLLGIRRLVTYLADEFDAPPVLMESVFLAAILLLFPALSRWISRQSESLFSGEITRHRRLAEAINDQAPRLLETSLLIEFIEMTLRRELPAETVRIVTDAVPVSGEGFLIPLSTPGAKIGYLQILSPELGTRPTQREALYLIANEIGMALERNRLVQSKLSLEKEVAAKSHMEELGKMAASVAHTVKNPLSSMKTLMQLFLEAENLSEDQRQDISMIISEINRLAKTITSLLQYSRTEGDIAKTEFDEVHLEHLLDSVRSVFRGELLSRNIRLETALQGLPQTICSNADTLSDILGNLFSNAIEVTPEGGTIRVFVGREEGSVTISVEDSGPGIPESLKEKIFEPFFTTKTGGTGLGLAIVKKRVAALGGSLSVCSPLTDRGTRFSLTLPQPDEQ